MVFFVGINARKAPLQSCIELFNCEVAFFSVGHRVDLEVSSFGHDGLRPEFHG
jgi:hypothetical protein